MKSHRFLFSFMCSFQKGWKNWSCVWFLGWGKGRCYIQLCSESSLSGERSARVKYLYEFPHCDSQFPGFTWLNRGTELINASLDVAVSQSGCEVAKRAHWCPTCELSRPHSPGTNSWKYLDCCFLSPHISPSLTFFFKICRLPDVGIVVVYFLFRWRAWMNALA